MSEVEITPVGVYVLRSAIAVVVAFVAYIVCSVVINAIVYWINIGGMGENVGRSFAAAVSGVMGIGGARWVLDATIKSYSKKSIFVTFCVMSVLALCGSIGSMFAYGFDKQVVFNAIAIAATLYAAFTVFWKDEQL